MKRSDSGAPRRVLAAFVEEHRDQIEEFAGSDKQTAWIAEAVLGCDQSAQRADGKSGE